MPDLGTSPPIAIQPLRSALQPRHLPLPITGREPGHALLVLQDGGAVLRIPGQEDRALPTPSIHWFRPALGERLVLEAGTVGTLALIRPDFPVRALSGQVEAPALLAMLERDGSLGPAETEGCLGAVARALEAMRAELMAPQFGAELVLAAELGLLLVALARARGLGEIDRGGAGGDARHLQRFRQLLEAHFRAHWPVGRYADQLGLSPDRLHAICQRRLGRTPKALIAERLAREAAQGLERSSLSIAQLSHALGFREPGHFSHFFKRMTGLTPRRFRGMASRPDPGGRDGGTGSAAGGFTPPRFSDWP